MHVAGGGASRAGFPDRISVAAVAAVNQWPCCVFVKLGQPPVTGPMSLAQEANRRRVTPACSAIGRECNSQRHSNIRTPTRAFGEDGSTTSVYKRERMYGRARRDTSNCIDAKLPVNRPATRASHLLFVIESNDAAFPLVGFSPPEALPFMHGKHTELGAKILTANAPDVPLALSVLECPRAQFIEAEGDAIQLYQHPAPSCCTAT
ncbi:hypothetical protein P3T76_011671 [Phytophthora citrophthora]|uniref:Uncharacterized protein n=1 Tax=Phytophthora citrophthora TaxID=4793 RepID=A0AAD9G8L7_9STRA|nr:hypothetical protein P3T76_011671 [Phytophthora citrophthora]